MSGTEFKQPFEVEFPDKDHPERDEIDTEFENGPGNATTAGYVENNATPAPEADEVLETRVVEAVKKGKKNKKRKRQRRLTGRLATHADASQFQPSIIYDNKHK